DELPERAHRGRLSEASTAPLRREPGSRRRRQPGCRRRRNQVHDFSSVRYPHAPMAEVVSTNQFRNGMHIELEGQTWRIVQFQHVKPGKGGAFGRTKLKSLSSGS